MSFCHLAEADLVHTYFLADLDMQALFGGVPDSILVVKHSENLTFSLPLDDSSSTRDMELFIQSRGSPLLGNYSEEVMTELIVSRVTKVVLHPTHHPSSQSPAGAPRAPPRETRDQSPSPCRGTAGPGKSPVGTPLRGRALRVLPGDNYSHRSAAYPSRGTPDYEDLPVS